MIMFNIQYVFTLFTVHLFLMKLKSCRVMASTKTYVLSMNNLCPHRSIFKGLCVSMEKMNGIFVSGMQIDLLCSVKNRFE